MRETLAAQVKELGFATQVAASGSEALALPHAGEEVDALVSDLSMPVINGVVSPSSRRACRVPLLTGYVGERAALSAQAAMPSPWSASPSPARRWSLASKLASKSAGRPRSADDKLPGRDPALRPCASGREWPAGYHEAAMVEDVLVLPYAKQGLIGEVNESARGSCPRNTARPAGC